MHLNACNFIKKETMAQVFSCEVFTEHLLQTTSEHIPKWNCFLIYFLPNISNFMATSCNIKCLAWEIGSSWWQNCFYFNNRQNINYFSEFFWQFPEFLLRFFSRYSDRNTGIWMIKTEIWIGCKYEITRHNNILPLYKSLTQWWLIFRQLFLKHLFTTCDIKVYIFWNIKQK